MTKPKCTQNSFKRAREAIARKITKKAQLAKIHFHLVRHWFGTIEYHRIYDLDHVRRLLGHRSILPKQIYINLERAIFSGTANEYHMKAVSTVEEATTLIEVGFEYVTEMDGKKLFKKRK